MGSYSSPNGAFVPIILSALRRSHKKRAIEIEIAKSLRAIRVLDLIIMIPLWMII